MRLLKFYLAFAAINAMLMAAMNRTLSGDWVFRFFLLVWMLSVGLSALAVGFLADRYVSNTRPVVRMLLVYLATFVICNLFMASFDPLQLGWLTNLAKTFQDRGTIFLVIAPYASSVIITCVWCALGARVAPATMALSKKQTA